MRRVYAVGGNPVAAEISGIDVRRYRHPHARGESIPGTGRPERPRGVAILFRTRFRRMNVHITVLKNGKIAE